MRRVALFLDLVKNKAGDEGTHNDQPGFITGSHYDRRGQIFPLFIFR